MKSLIKNSFIKNVVTLVAGTSIAQLIPILISPILTRIYTPEDFGLYAILIAISSICAIGSCLRYEYAIVQEKDSKNAIVLLRLSVYVCLILSIVIFFLCIFFGSYVSSFFGVNELQNIIFLVPLIVILLGLFKALNLYAVRNEKYKNISLSNIYQSSSLGAGQIYLKNSQFGLIYGYIFGHLIGLVSLFYKSLMFESRIIKQKVTFSEVKKMASKYYKLPFFSTPAAIADSMTIQIPILLIVKFFSESIAGFYSLTFRVLNLPASFLSQGIAQPLLKKISQMDNTTNEQFLFICKVFVTLFGIISPFVLLIWLYGVDLFMFIFGAEWKVAGEYSKIIIFAVAARFIVSPLSVVFLIDKNIKIGTMWQYLYLITLTVTLLIFSNESISIFLIAFTVHEIILYLIYLLMILKASLPKRV
jgi:O-antigen/teichoic acid export membrane protein